MYQWLLELISVSSYRFDTTEIVFIINLISDIASLAETLTFGKGGYQTPNLTSGKGRVGISDVYLFFFQYPPKNAKKRAEKSVRNRKLRYVTRRLVVFDVHSRYTDRVRGKRIIIYRMGGFLWNT